MGLNKSKTLLPVEEPMTQEDCIILETIYEKQDADSLKQFRVIEKYLIEDEKEYNRDVNAYREKQGSYVIFDKNIIKRGEELMLRKAINWNNSVNLKWENL
jgi:hypothetical protein